MRNLFAITVLLLLFNLLVYYSEARHAAKTVKITCIGNPVTVMNVSCRLRPINRYTTVADLDGDLVMKLKNISLQLDIFFKNYANRYLPMGFHYFGNMCDIFKKKAYPTLGVLSLRVLSRYTNINHSCPYTGHIMARSLTFGEELMGFALPIGSYKATVTFSEGYPFIHVFTTDIYLNVFDMVETHIKEKKN